MRKDKLPLTPKIEIFGVPFDATSTYRPGSRFGPDAIRGAFANIEVYSKDLNVDLEKVSIEDLGDIKQTLSIERMTRLVGETLDKVIGGGCIPAVLGGEHTVTFVSFSAMPKNTALLVFDAHLDLRDEYADLRLMHATFLRRLLEERPDLLIIHVGTRAAAEEEWDFAKRHKLKLISSQDVLSGRSLALLKKALKKTNSLYVSIDLDVVDPAWAPGVSNPEPVGISPQSLLDHLRVLTKKKILGFDIVELCPPFDYSNITAVVAAKLLSELCFLVNYLKAR